MRSSDGPEPLATDANLPANKHLAFFLGLKLSITMNIHELVGSCPISFNSFLSRHPWEHPER